jgi:hypothetical protein
MSFNVYTYPKFEDRCLTFGLIKEFSKHHEKINVYADEVSINEFNTAKRLYASIKNVELFQPLTIDVREDFSIAHSAAWQEKTHFWYENINLPLPDWDMTPWQFDRQWYANSCLSFHYKWDNFYFERDPNKEKEVYYDILGLKDGQQYIFIVEDPQRNILLNRKLIDDKYEIIAFNKYPDANILDCLYAVEKAKEVHTYNTGLRTFIDLMNIKHDSLTYHKYARPGLIFEQPTMRGKWNVIEKENDICDISNDL